MNSTPSLRKPESLISEISCAVAAGLLLLGLSYLRLWGDAGSAAFGGKVLDAVVTGPIIGTKLGNNILWFVVAQAVLHLGFALSCIPLGRISAFAWPSQIQSRKAGMLAWFLAGAAWILLANATWFPASSLGTPYAGITARQWWGMDMLTALTILIGAAIAATLLRAALRADRSQVRAVLPWAAPIGAVLLIAGVFLRQDPALATATPADKPNIVIIGLDSLRFDAIRRTPTITPAIDSLLKEAVTFTDATTPLARTFPSWVSLITGRHPHTTGATVNLLPRHLIDTGETLPQLLRRAGYRSVYAIDEVRFSNLDLSYGFDQMISPPIGATDFLLGFFSDTPLSNVVMNTWLGRVLFPYTHGNRAASLTYEPDTFVRRIDRSLDVQGPTLLAIHLTLAHWPYTWAGSPPVNGARADTASLYEKAVARLDQQFDAVLDVLRSKGVLENAVVIVLSDHGEDLYSPAAKHDSGLDPRFDPTLLFGHGTSVFSKHQYHVVMAARTFGNNRLELPRGMVVTQPVSIEDVTPTIADLLSLQPQSSFDGMSLLPLLRNEPGVAETFATRIRFTETEFNPPGLTAMGTFATASAMRSVATFYRIDPNTDRVMLRAEDVGQVLSMRQYAAFRGPRMVAAFPSLNSATSTLDLGLAEQGTQPILLTRAMLDSDPEAVALWDALGKKFPKLPAQVVLAREVGTGTSGTP